MAPSRKASDHFTRFTSATPHASSYQIPRSSPSFNASSPSSNIPSSSPGPARNAPPSSGHPNETPAEKVARLRAAHRAAQEAAAFSRVDRIILTGRVVADRIHRATAYSLMGFTVVAGSLAVYSFISLVSHHRRQRRAWIERELQRLSDAQTAFLRGEATAEQLHLLEQERAGEEIQIQWKEEKERKKASSLWGKTKRAFYRLGGVEEEESLGAKARKGEYGGIMDMVREKETDSNRLLTDGEGQVDISHPGESSPGLVDMVDEHRRVGEKEMIVRTEVGQRGGILDQMAEHTTSAVVDSGRSWFSWGQRKS